MSNPPIKPFKKNRLPRTIFRWHRRIGITASAFAIWIVISGWLLNHADGFGLAHQQLHSSVLANWYGLHTDIPDSVFNTQNHWLTANHEAALLDGTLLTQNTTEPVGLVEAGGFLIIANENNLVLLTEDGKLIDVISQGDLPVTQVRRIGTGCNANIIIQDTNELFTSNDGINWQNCTGEQSVIEKIIWSTAKAISDKQLIIAKKQFIPSISLEKLVIDMHTGRFFGKYGPYVIDVIGLCLLLLALSGIWMFLRSHGNHARKEGIKNPDI